ncbi:uncharacterized protein P174DRAFT_110348 [Aspergillus novofumigatus IBT 16806]|uniref:Uncharacterized protein n=1 Tax=Aspergillus novofumigatus (strain IBT 16806) TaxID=1392255 RepID=A0A2I1CII0_ASPN1|nr:uncharacterized protein P174DRAFT_110348 [Aspergillus novofumigatus IBT 16806]PKX97436.1 hypothetical protein P174DRAFT_110348 [Aspergillus novofumigatus IBT 16806]
MPSMQSMQTHSHVHTHPILFGHAYLPIRLTSPSYPTPCPWNCSSCPSSYCCCCCCCCCCRCSSLSLIICCCNTILYTLALSSVHTVAVLRSSSRNPSSVNEVGSPASPANLSDNYTPSSLATPVETRST